MGASPSPRKTNKNKVHWLQHHWYRITPLHLILFPVSLVFRMLVALRRVLYRNGLLNSHRLPLPVIVVGNISVGGTGKTPLTLALAQQLVERGWHPLIVSRGYGRTSSNPQPVNPSNTAAEAGDEPLLMARRNICPVWVGADRVATAQEALQVNPHCDVVLCDDGLQHYRLQRDVEIAVIDGARRFGNGLLLPAGPLREPVSRLRKVDAAVVNGGDPLPGQFSMRLDGAVFYNLLDPRLSAVPGDFRQTRNHAVAGIGNPQRYFRHLQELGVSFTPHAFPDHHPYCSADLSFADSDAILLTEKDGVKCAAFADARYWVLRVDAQIDPSLIDPILRKIAPHGHQAA
ncbi:MAG: tetraacyldisaccharide 4'-kinase [Nitrosomonadales bacterium]|nr:tetraacyldisaccharide 4'-kinase [Nitrosomonadales bacterium]